MTADDIAADQGDVARLQVVRDAVFLAHDRKVVGRDRLHLEAVVAQVVRIPFAAAALRVLVEGHVARAGAGSAISRMPPIAPPTTAAAAAPSNSTLVSARRFSLYLKILIMILLAGSLCDANDAHHSGLLVVGDVAVKHPVAGVVGDKGEVGALAWRDEHRVAPLSTGVRLAVPADDPKAVPVQMHRVPPRGLVP